jgi:hypothetical protein
MAEITIEYDARNTIAKKMIEFILSFDFIKVKEKGLSETRQAMQDALNGDVLEYGTVEDYLEKTKKYA